MTNINTKNAIEFGLTAKKTEFVQEKITDSKSSADYIRQFYFDDINIYESAFILLLNRQLKVIGYAKISQGGTCGTVIDVKIICKYALDSLAPSVILAHNHPSGSLHPSSEDIAVTAKVKDGLKMFDITLIDHIILTSGGYYSFADECRL